MRIAHASIVHIRMLRPAGGVLDGLNLSHLAPGVSYDVSDSLADYLVMMGFARRIRSTDVIDPSSDECVDEELMHVTQGVRVSGRAPRDLSVAAEKPPRARPRRRL